MNKQKFLPFVVIASLMLIMTPILLYMRATSTPFISTTKEYVDKFPLEKEFSCLNFKQVYIDGFGLTTSSNLKPTSEGNFLVAGTQNYKGEVVYLVGKSGEILDSYSLQNGYVVSVYNDEIDPRNIYIFKAEHPEEEYQIIVKSNKINVDFSNPHNPNFGEKETIPVLSGNVTYKNDSKSVNSFPDGGMSVSWTEYIKVNNQQCGSKRYFVKSSAKLDEETSVIMLETSNTYV